MCVVRAATSQEGRRLPEQAPHQRARPLAPGMRGKAAPVALRDPPGGTQAQPGGRGGASAHLSSWAAGLRTRGHPATPFRAHPLSPGSNERAVRKGEECRPHPPPRGCPTAAHPAHRPLCGDRQMPEREPAAPPPRNGSGKLLGSTSPRHWQPQGPRLCHPRGLQWLPPLHPHSRD